jgi:hypothetical protein
MRLLMLYTGNGPRELKYSLVGGNWGFNAQGDPTYKVHAKTGERIRFTVFNRGYGGRDFASAREYDTIASIGVNGKTVGKYEFSRTKGPRELLYRKKVMRLLRSMPEELV